MKIAITAQGKTLQDKVDARFGRCPFFVIYNTETKEIQIVDNQDIEQEAHGAGPRTVQRLSEFECNVLITGNGPGGNASTLLSKMNIEIFVGAGDMIIEKAVEAYLKGELKKF